MTLGPRLAQKTGALVVVAWAERLPRGRGYVLHYVPAPDPVGGDDLTASAAALNATVEGAIRGLPEQWLWSYKRFKIRPLGLPNPYDGALSEAPSRPV